MRLSRSFGRTVGFIVKVTLAAVIGILIFKWLARRVKIPGVTRTAEAV